MDSKDPTFCPNPYLAPNPAPALNLAHKIIKSIKPEKGAGASAGS